MAYKPEDYNDLSAYLCVDDAPALVDFLQAAFGAETLRMYEHEGALMHGEMRIGDSVIMLASATAEWPAIQAVLHLYVPDCDAAYRAALAAGAEGVQPPNEREGDPDRRGTFKDPFGNTWSVSTEVNG